MLNYRSVQNTGAWNIDWNNGKRPEQLYDAMRELVSNIRKTARTIFNAQMTAHILSSPLQENTVRLPPAAMRLFAQEKTGSPEQKRGGRHL
jgi:hypothetical protein